MPKTHYLKTHSEFYKEVKARKKRFELRKDDRNIQIGDFLMLQEIDPATQIPSGDQTLVHVSLKLENAEKFGLKKDHAIFGIEFFEEVSIEIQEKMEEVCKSPLSR